MYALKTHTDVMVRVGYAYRFAQTLDASVRRDDLLSAFCLRF